MQEEVITGFRLSPQQSRLWQLRSEVGDGSLRAGCAAAVSGPLDTAALASALQRLVDRHEILRTAFRCAPGMNLPLQFIADAAAVELELASPVGGEEETLDRLFEQALASELDLTRVPQLGAVLATLSSEDHVLALALPAMCCDSAGLENLVRDLARTYAAVRDGRELDDEPIQYADVAEVFNDLCESEETAAGRRHWQRQELRQQLDWRLPQETGGGEGFEPRTLAVALDGATARAVAEIATAEPATAEAFFLTCWSLLLRRLGGGSQPVIGLYQSGRTYEELEDAIGLTARMLPVRLEAVESQPFGEALTTARRLIAEAAEWQDYFRWEVRDGAAEPTPDGALQVDPPAAAHRGGEASFRLRRRRVTIDRFKVKLVATPAADLFELELQYDARRLQAREAKRLAASLRALLASVTGDPERPLGALEVLDEAERHRLLVAANDTAAGFPHGSCVHHLFEQQVQRTPEATALVCGERRWSFAELDDRANLLAHRLVELGVGPDVPVGLCGERSLEILAGLWSILKAGGAYVPLDPHHPRERLAFMLEDTELSVVLTLERWAEVVRGGGRQVICLDDLGEAGVPPPAVRVAPLNLAYLLYTSGSTGVPKGVMVTHRGLVNYLSWCGPTYGAGKDWGAPVGSPLTFDLTVTGLFAPLLGGRTVELLPEDEGPDSMLAALRSDRRFSLVKLTPLQLQVLSQSLAPEATGGRTGTLVIGGEPLTAEGIEFWRRHAPDTRLVNEYGPTETVVGCCVFEVPSDFPAAGPVPIGRPIANTRLYVVERRLRPVSEGVTGELLIGGEGTARGYFARPGLTAERFVPDALSGEAGERLYRSGDLVRYRVDGQLEFVGRLDHQVKVRGYRIELAEVEAVLRRHPQVSELVVQTEDDGHRRLAAYLVAEGDPPPAPEELRAWLRDRLPEYMIPSLYIPLPALPLTANGKVDRRALATMDTHRRGLRKPFVAPRTDAEKVMASIWSSVLGIEPVGIHDNFFDLGGDSILSIQVVSRANLAGLRVAPKQMFEYQTIAELAAAAGTASELVADQGEVVGEAPLTPIQRRFFEARPPDPDHFNQSVMLRLRRPLTPAVIEAALRRLLAHHDALRLRFERGEDGWKQRCARIDGNVALTCFDLSLLNPMEQSPAIEATAARLQQGLDLARGPLLRAAFFDLGPERSSRLLLIVHHLAIDGVSWRVLLEDFETLCTSEAGPHAAVLPPKTCSFRHWSEQLLEAAQSDALLAELDYWLAVHEPPPVLLPTDSSRGPNNVASARTVQVTLGREETRALLQQAPLLYHNQIPDFLLAALVETRCRWDGERSLLVDLESHGREGLAEDLDVSRTIGWFATSYPVLLDLTGVYGPGEVLLAIKEQLRSIPGHGAGYSLLRYLHQDPEVAARLGSLPQPQVGFNYLGQFDQLFGSTSLLSPATESAGPPHGPQRERWHLLGLHGMVSEERLQIGFAYSENRHRRAVIEELAESFLGVLRSLIQHCLETPRSGFLAADAVSGDVPESVDLDRLLSAVEFES